MKAKTKFTKLWSILLALAMVVGMLPTIALAAGSATADFSTDPTTALELLNAAKTGTTDSTWDNDTKTLTLGGVNFTTTAATAVKLPNGAIIVLNGENIIKGGSGSGDRYGIKGEGSLTIQGSGTLNVTGGEAGGFGFGIRAETGVTIKGGAVDATGGTAGSQSFGIYTLNGDLTIEGGIVKATGGAASESSGLWAANGSLVISGGNVEALGGNVSGTSSGIFAKNVVFKNTDNRIPHVTTRGGEARYSRGIYIVNYGSLTISGGSLIADSEDALSERPAALPVAYSWRTSSGDDFTVSAVTAYNWSGYHSYVEIRDNTAAYTVSFDANGGSGTMATDPGVFGAYTLPSNGFTAPEGKQFKAWSVDGTEKAVGDKITVTADTTITAVWETLPAAPADYEIYVNGEQFTSEKTTINCGDGTATFDISTNTLILNNATITKRYGSQYAVINSEISNLTIQLIGNNVIDGNKGEYDGIGAKGGSNVVIVGDGNLTMKDVYYGTYIGDYSVPGGNLKINNTTINIENAQATGIWVNHDLEIINSNIKIDKTGDDVYFGIVSNIGGTITIDGGNLDINTNSHCILLGNGDNSNHNVVIKSGNIKLNSRRNGAYGIKFEPVRNTDTINGNIKIDGGNLEISTIAGGTNIDDSKITINSKVKFLKGTSLKDNGEILLKEAKNYYTVTFAANGGKGTMADVTGVLGDYTLPENGFTAPEGKQFKTWSVDGKEKAVGDKITVTADTTVKAVWETLPAAPADYDILDGANSKWTQDSDGNISVRGSGEFSKFVGVKVDGKTVDEKYYTVKEGSTIVTLKPEYLNTLTAGKHTLEIVWTDGTADTTFTVDAKPANTDPKSPQTGDSSSIALWIALIFVSAAGVLSTAVLGKKKKRSAK